MASTVFATLLVELVCDVFVMAATIFEPTLSLRVPASSCPCAGPKARFTGLRELALKQVLGAHFYQGFRI